MTIEKPDYSMYIPFDTWTLEDASNIVFSQYRYEKGSELSEDELNVKKERVKEILKQNVRKYSDNIKRYPLLEEDGSLIYDDYNELCEEVDFIETEVDIKKFIKFALVSKLPFPEELRAAFLPKNVPHNVAKAAGDISAEADYKSTDNGDMPQDVKDMDLPMLRKKVAELTIEKDKWDRSITAAAQIGLLFYENELPKPITKDEFIQKFTLQLGEGLPDSTIEKIYKLLPSDYKLKGGRPKKTAGTDNGTANIDTVAIRAAVYAGSIYDTSDAKKPTALMKVLKEAEYDVPSDEILNKIIAAVKEI